MNSIISFRGIDAVATGERIKHFRKKNGYTVDELCDIFFISPQAVYKWQNGKALPSLDNMLVLCDIFGVKVEDIVVREDAVSSVFFYFLLEIEKNRGSMCVHILKERLSDKGCANLLFPWKFLENNSLLM